MINLTKCQSNSPQEPCDQPTALNDPMVQCLFLFQGCFSQVWDKGVHLLIGWGAPKVSADPVASRRHFWTAPCCLQCPQQPRYVATQPNLRPPWRKHWLTALQLLCLPQPE